MDKLQVIEYILLFYHGLLPITQGTKNKGTLKPHFMSLGEKI